MKILIGEKFESRRAHSVRFTRSVLLCDPGSADEIEAESLEDYVVTRRTKIQNPKTVTHVAIRGRKELLERIEELQTENEGLKFRLDEVADLVEPKEEGTGEEGEE